MTVVPPLSLPVKIAAEPAQQVENGKQGYDLKALSMNAWVPKPMEMDCQRKTIEQIRHAAKLLHAHRLIASCTDAGPCPPRRTRLRVEGERISGLVICDQGG